MELTAQIGRLSFVFLPDNKRMMLSSGDRIIHWA